MDVSSWRAVRKKSPPPVKERGCRGVERKRGVGRQKEVKV